MLKNTAADAVRAELPEGYVFQDVDVFCSHLAGMIDRQPNGKGGALLNNGYANIFYINVGDRVVAVYVHWSAGLCKWSVNAYELDDDMWPAGRRVFSAAAAA